MYFISYIMSIIIYIMLSKAYPFWLLLGNALPDVEVRLYGRSCEGDPATKGFRVARRSAPSLPGFYQT